MDAADAGPNPGPVTGGRMVPWKNDDLKEFLAVEAYHMSMARSVLYRMGGEAREAANKLSDARDKLEGMTGNLRTT
jgi:hypothetical protein